MDERTRQGALARIRAVLAILARLQAYFDAMDAGTFREEDHPRAPDGKFGAGGNHAENEDDIARKIKAARNTPPVVRLTYNELKQKNGESLRDAAERYYEQLSKEKAERKGFGVVNFYKESGWKKFKSTSMKDKERLKLLPAVKPVIEKGENLGNLEPSEDQKKSIKRFHYFAANIDTPDGKKFVGVTVIEDKAGNKFYNLTENPDALYERHKARRAKEANQFSSDRRYGSSLDADLRDILFIRLA